MAELFCGCPPTYTLNQYGVCENTTTEGARAGETTYETVLTGSDDTFGSYGAYIFEEITLKPLPILQLQVGVTDSVTTTDFLAEDLEIDHILNTTLWNTRLSDVGVWTTLSPNPVSEWIGHTFCADVDEERVFYLGFGSTVKLRIYLNEQLIHLSDHTTSPGYKRWQILPITLSPGLNRVLVEGRTDVSVPLPSFGAELYDCTLAQLLAATSAEINPYIVFSTESRSGDNFDTGEDSGYDCDTGFNLENCSGTRSCVQRLFEEKGPCCTILTNCQDSSIQIQTNLDLEEYVGKFVNIQLQEGCWEVSTAILPCTDIEEVTVTDSFDTCQECVPVDEVCYTLIDCKDDQNTMKVRGNLNGYVDQTIEIDDFDGCWKVSISEDPCIPSLYVFVTDYFEDCDACTSDNECCKPKKCCHG